MYLDDVIAAIATPFGEGGIAIIRMSGAGSEKVLEKIFKPRNKNVTSFKSHTLYLGNIIDSNTNTVIDEVLVSVMYAPKSYTAENVVEIYTHGGIVVAKKVLELLLQFDVRLAEAGEFTKRAFLNGRIDLSQAESVIDIIRAKTETGLNLAVKQLEGALSKKISSIRNTLLEIIAHIEAEIDFPDEDIDSMDIETISSKLNEVLLEIDELLKDSEKGKIYREGLSVVIIGRPNVGKSSLLNALLREKRAIVTDIPGTTRDVIEEYLNIGGIPVRIIDTAGLRETEDVVEKIGVERSRELLETSDLVLFLLDAATGITDEDILLLESIKKLDKNVLVLVNKIDLDKKLIDNKDVKNIEKDFEVLQISAKEEIGLEELEKTIENMVFKGDITPKESIFVTRARHQEALYKAQNSIKEALNTIAAGMTGEFLSIDIKDAWESLGKITGDTIEEDVLDKIFSEFCIGK